MNRQLITSALPYINGVKHLGNLIGSMLPADVYARYMRQRGEDVLYICATDEHGTPAELAALEAGISVRQYCDEQHAVQAALAERWGLSFDHYGRSSSPQNVELTQHFARMLRDNGYLEVRTTIQAFSVADDRFLPDRYVIGTCPRCGYERARGDQCENCTSVLDPSDLIEPRSAVSGSTDIEFRESKHLFLLQSKLVDQLRAWVESKDEWPVLARSIALKWLDEGLEDRGITRDLQWGVPVPDDFEGLEGKVFYVWFDAPIEYIAATKEWADAAPGAGRDWKSWWFDAKDVTYTEFMAKDNVPFHSISFPATLIGSGEPWTRVDHLKAFNWLTYYGGKFSTSQKRGVFMDTALELLPADVWRYMLLANAPESSDADFTWELLATAVNKDLAGTYGNFVNRLLQLTASKFGPTVPIGGEPGAAEHELVADLDAAVARMTDALDGLQFRKAMQELRAIWSMGNAYLDRKAPWKAIKTDPADAALTIRTGFGLVRLFAQLSTPAMPETSARILAAVGESAAKGWIGSTADVVLGFPAERAFTVPDVLFEKVTDEKLDEWRERFGADA